VTEGFGTYPEKQKYLYDIGIKFYYIIFSQKLKKTKNMTSFKINWNTIRQGAFPKKQLEEMGLGLIIDIYPLTNTQQEITISNENILTSEDIFYIGSIVSKLQKF
jgi:hypothetical protein